MLKPPYWIALPLLLTSLACGQIDSDEQYREPDSGSETNTHTEIDETIAIIPATSTAWRASYAFSGQADGTDAVHSVAVEANLSTVDFNHGDHVGFVYQSHAWEEAGYTLYDVLSIAEDGSNMAVSYLYSQGDNLTYIYSESFEHTMQGETATGTCNVRHSPTSSQVNLPRLDTPPTPYDSGIDIVGENINIHAGVGRATIAGEDYDLTTFSTVDCTDCPGGPWYELHSFLSTNTAGCFGVLYVFPADRGRVDLQYGLCLPSLEPLQQSFDATWSGGFRAHTSRPPLWRPNPRRP